MRKLAAIALVLGIFVWVKLSDRSRADSAVLAEMQQLIQELDAYDANAEYMDELLQREHTYALAAAYAMGTRRQAASLDHMKYFERLLDGMIEDAGFERKPEVADELQGLRMILLATAEQEL